MSLQISGRTASLDNGRIVVRRERNGWSIEYRGTNPNTRYWSPRLTWLDRLRYRLWQRRMSRAAGAR